MVKHAMNLFTCPIVATVTVRSQELIPRTVTFTKRTIHPMQRPDTGRPADGVSLRAPPDPGKGHRYAQAAAATAI